MANGGGEAPPPLDLPTQILEGDDAAVLPLAPRPHPAGADPSAVGEWPAVEEGDASGDRELGAFRSRVQHCSSRIDELAQRVREVSRFYSNRQQQQVTKGGGGKEKVLVNGHKKQTDVVGRKNGSCTKRMQELMRQVGTILRQISQDKWAWPFMEPVDVEGLGLDDYYEIIKKPMDFSTIRNKMEVKDGTGYKSAREIHADVRLVFTNAMTYNEETHDIHCMAKKLMERFEEKWLQLLPKVTEEETRQKEDSRPQPDLQISKEVAIAKMAIDTNSELTEVNVQLEELRNMVIKRLNRKISTDEKRRILSSFSKLPLEQINRTIKMISQHNPNFPTSEVLIDMDAQSESTLWKLKSCINTSLKLEAKNSANKGQDNAKRKKEICDALVKNAKKRIKKL